eukprot:1649094-Alexandrium_andersonii.AAC.1
MKAKGYASNYSHTKTLQKGGKLLPFSLITMHTKEARDEVLTAMSNYDGLYGMYGGKCWVQKNIAKYQREAGQFLRMIMLAIEKAHPGTKFSNKGWDYDALKIEGKWVAAIAGTPGKGNERCKSVLLNEEIVDKQEVAKHLATLWRTWNGFSEKWTQPGWVATTGECPVTFASSSANYLPFGGSSSSSYWQNSESSSRQYYIQQHWTYAVFSLGENHKEALDSLAMDKEDRDENRKMPKAKQRAASSAGAAAPPPGATESSEMPVDEGG